MRIGVAPGGCSGMTYAATIDSEIDDNDVVVYEQDGIRVVSDGKSLEHLDGLTIDYSDDLIRSGFRFRNPNACGSCGCGASFGGQ
jgi:iron-sulfur cluster assembly protein